jgi:hypothetical protein
MSDCECGHKRKRHQWVMDRRDICSEKGCDCSRFRPSPVPPEQDEPTRESEIAWQLWSNQRDIQRGKYNTWDAFMAGWYARGREDA